MLSSVVYFWRPLKCWKVYQKEMKITIIFTVLQEWIQSAPDVKLHLPAPNIFIPTDLSLNSACEKV